MAIASSSHRSVATYFIASSIIGVTACGATTPLTAEGPTPTPRSAPQSLVRARLGGVGAVRLRMWRTDGKMK
jgi:hypothetical protein